MRKISAEKRKEILDRLPFSFEKEDFHVQRKLYNVAGGIRKPMDWGRQIADDDNAVTVTHKPTGISATVEKFHVARNIEIAKEEIIQHILAEELKWEEKRAKTEIEKKVAPGSKKSKKGKPDSKD